MDLFKFLVVLSIAFLSFGCAGPNGTPPAEEGPIPPYSYLGYSYNGVLSTFQRINVNSVHERGFRGSGVRVNVTDASNNIDFSNPLLVHTVLPGSIPPVGAPGHTTDMALTLAGAKSTEGNVGIAPSVKITNFGARIVTDSSYGNNLIAYGLGYCFPIGGITLANPFLTDPPIAPATQIYVIIAGNLGNSTPTKIGQFLPDDYYPVNENIIVTVALDDHDRLTSASQPCGRSTRRFCIGVPSTGATSPTAPIVGGALALLMEAQPGRPLARYVNAVLKTARPLGNPDETGVGMLDVAAALRDLETNP